MSTKYRNILGGLALIASVGVTFMPPKAEAVARQVSDVDWENWQKGDGLYEGRFGKAYSVGIVTVSRPSSNYFVIFQVKNTSSLVIDVRCEVKADASGKVLYAMDQRLKPGQLSDLDGAGDMLMNHQGETYEAKCSAKLPLL